MTLIPNNNLKTPWTKQDLIVKNNIMIKDELITFETAKLAKEKGFNEPCYFAYDEDGNIDSAIDFTGNPTFNIEDILTCQSNGYEAYLAPTQSLLQKWLREKHDLIVECSFDFVESGKYNCAIIEKKINGIYHSSSAIHIDTYEEALEKALQEGLKLIL